MCLPLRAVSCPGAVLSLSLFLSQLWARKQNISLWALSPCLQRELALWELSKEP